MSRNAVTQRPIPSRTPQATTRVRVLAPSGTALRDCAFQRADEMVSRGRAAWVSTEPPIIKLTPKKS